MTDSDLNFEIPRLGEPRIPSPMSGVQFVGEAKRVLYHGDISEIQELLESGRPLPGFEVAGPRKDIYFDPSKMKCGIVTCGGLCPGLNDVIRAVVMSLYHHYGVRTIYGFRYGFEGLVSSYKHPVTELTPESVLDLHKRGGTVLGSSRGSQDVPEMVDTLERMNVSLLFAVGGDGTLRAARGIAEEIANRQLKIGVIGIPKTIDNDISYVDQSFGFETAVSEAAKAIRSANIEAEGAPNGVGLVKLMGRHSGFIAAYASLAYSDVNFCLVPEVAFSLDAFLRALQERLEKRGHAVVVVAEGAGQDLLSATNERDASGNVRLGDIGPFLKDHITRHCKAAKMGVNLKYIDPSYTIRSTPANPHDSVFCLLLGHNAVHAGMAGRTNMVVGNWRSEFTHVPISAAVSRRKTIGPGGRLWSSVVEATGQPRQMI
jgi:6-phosphofructokinase 1